MEITEHQAKILQALLDRKRIQYRRKAVYANEKDYVDVEDWTLVLTFLMSPTHEVRIKPDVIIVNGIEVPAPEKVPPTSEERYYVASPTDDEGYRWATWCDDEQDLRYLRLQVLHKTQEAAVSHSKAMLAHKPG